MNISDFFHSCRLLMAYLTCQVDTCPWLDINVKNDTNEKWVRHWHISSRAHLLPLEFAVYGNVYFKASIGYGLLTNKMWEQFRTHKNVRHRHRGNCERSQLSVKTVLLSFKRDVSSLIRLPPCKMTCRMPLM